MFSLFTRCFARPKEHKEDIIKDRERSQDKPSPLIPPQATKELTAGSQQHEARRSTASQPASTAISSSFTPLDHTSNVLVDELKGSRSSSRQSMAMHEASRARHPRRMTTPAASPSRAPAAEATAGTSTDMETDRTLAPASSTCLHAALDTSRLRPCALAAPASAGNRLVRSFSTSSTGGISRPNDLSMHLSMGLSARPSTGPSTGLSTMLSTNLSLQLSSGAPTGLVAHAEPMRDDALNPGHAEPIRDSAMMHRGHVRLSCMDDSAPRTVCHDGGEARRAESSSAAVQRPPAAPRRSTADRDGSALRAARRAGTQSRMRGGACSSREHAASRAAAGKNSDVLRGWDAEHGAAHRGLDDGALLNNVSAASSLRMVPKSQQVAEWLSSGAAGADFAARFAAKPGCSTARQQGQRERAGPCGRLHPEQPPGDAACFKASEEGDSYWDLLDLEAWKRNWGLPQPDPNTCHSPFTCLSGYQSCSDSPRAWQPCRSGLQQ